MVAPARSSSEFKMDVVAGCHARLASLVVLVCTLVVWFEPLLVGAWILASKRGVPESPITELGIASDLSSMIALSEVACSSSATKENYCER